MGQTAKDFGYTEQESVEAVEIYQYFGNQNLEDVPIPVECARPLDSTIDIRADAGFLRDFPNIHVACSCINNPKESLAPNCIPFAFTNLSMHSQYLGKDKVVGFAQPTAEDVEVHALANHDELTEMMWGPRNYIPHKQQAKYKLPIIHLDNAFLTSPADVPGPRKVDLQDADITPHTRSAQGFLQRE